jgi:transposase InsO family protein
MTVASADEAKVQCSGVNACKRQSACKSVDLHDEAPNQRSVADCTYIWTDEGWLCVAVVLDLFSRRIVGWSMNSTMTAQLVTDALLALWRRGDVVRLSSCCITRTRAASIKASSFSVCWRITASPAVSWVAV